MPTIEVISVDSKNVHIKQSDFIIAIKKNTKLKSHRSLFYDYLIEQNGIIIHLGDPSMIHEYVFFAGDLIDWDYEPVEIEIPFIDTKNKKFVHENNCGANQSFKFKFLPNFINDINRILINANKFSPIKKSYFLTDYQFGPEKPNFVKIDNIISFWETHDTNGLIFNTLYEFNNL